MEKGESGIVKEGGKGKESEERMGNAKESLELKQQCIKRIVR